MCRVKSSACKRSRYTHPANLCRVGEIFAHTSIFCEAIQKTARKIPSVSRTGSRLLSEMGVRQTNNTPPTFLIFVAPSFASVRGLSAFGSSP